VCKISPKVSRSMSACSVAYLPAACSAVISCVKGVAAGGGKCTSARERDCAGIIQRNVIPVYFDNMTHVAKDEKLVPALRRLGKIVVNLLWVRPIINFKVGMVGAHLVVRDCGLSLSLPNSAITVVDEIVFDLEILGVERIADFNGSPPRTRT